MEQLPPCKNCEGIGGTSGKMNAVTPYEFPRRTAISIHFW